MICCLHQPSYFPWLGLLDKIAKTDVFVLLDDTQLSKGTYQYRNIFLHEGQPKFLTLPLKMKLGAKFCELEFRDSNWRDEHLVKLQNYYLKAPFFKEIYPLLQSFYAVPYRSPLDALISSMRFCMDQLQIPTSFVLKSSLPPIVGQKGEMVLNTCLALGATDYLAGQGSYNYMQEYLDAFKNSGIQVHWHRFIHPVYQQNPQYPFVMGLSCLDALFYLGTVGAKLLFWDNLRDTHA